MFYFIFLDGRLWGAKKYEQRYGLSDTIQRDRSSRKWEHLGGCLVLPSAALPPVPLVPLAYPPSTPTITGSSSQHDLAAITIKSHELQLNQYRRRAGSSALSCGWNDAF